MGFRDILVHLDISAAAETRMDLAILYARKHGARLRGLHPIAHSCFGLRDIDELSGAERVEAKFREKTAAAGVASELVCVDWSVNEVSVTDIMTLHAYYSDLVIVGQTNSRSPSGSIPADLPERLVVNCGRPVLVVPYAGTFETAGNRIMIAWKAGRESVRAINDAMPCLEMADYVSVLGVSVEETSIESNSHFRHLCDCLAQHNITARAEQVSAENYKIGDILLNRTCDNSIDLMVIGACSPTLKISPVARHVLKHMAIPVLISH